MFFDDLFSKVMISLLFDKAKHSKGSTSLHTEKHFFNFVHDGRTKNRAGSKQKSKTKSAILLNHREAQERVSKNKSLATLSPLINIFRFKLLI